MKELVIGWMTTMEKVLPINTPCPVIIGAITFWLSIKCGLKEQPCVLYLREGKVLIDDSLLTALDVLRFDRFRVNKDMWSAVGFLKSTEWRFGFSSFCVILTPIW